MLNVTFAFIISVMLHLSLASGSAAATTFSADDAALDALKRKTQTIYRSFQNKGGIAVDDEPILEQLRSEYAAYNQANPGSAAGIMGELQMSAWLEDHDRVDALYERLVLLNPDATHYATAWADYFARQDNTDRVEAIYDQLLQINPGSVDLRVARARQYAQRVAYPRALDLLDAVDLDPAEHGEGVLLRAEVLFAENRFQEAVDALQSIPEDVLNARPQLGIQVRELLPQYEQYAEQWQRELELRSTEAGEDDLPQVEIITPRGRILLELFENQAPNTVANFVSLAERGFYNMTTFHRVEPTFVSQGGDPNTKIEGGGPAGTGGPGYVIADEIGAHSRRHFAGVISMANSGPNTNGSQFFLTHAPTPHLDGRHTVFGRVLEGLDVVRSLEVDDRVQSMVVLRKRDHAYEVVQYDPSGVNTADTTDAADPGDTFEMPQDIPEELQQQIRDLMEQEAQQEAGDQQ